MSDIHGRILLLMHVAEAVGRLARYSLSIKFGKVIGGHI